MIDKQYKCLNGNPIKVGQEYKSLYDEWLLVIGYDKDGIVCSAEDAEEYFLFHEKDFASLWQEQPDKDGWIKHTTSEQPVPDIKWVDAKWSDGFISYGVKASLLRTWKKDTTCPLGWVTHYRIVEDKQEPEESELKDIRKRLSRLEALVLGNI